MGILSEFVYLGMGIKKDVKERVINFIKEGKKETKDRTVFETVKEDIDDKKKYVQNILYKDVKRAAEDLGFATKKDIEDLKDYIKQNIGKTNDN